MVRLSRSSQQRARRGRCGARLRGRVPRSANASTARRSSMAPALTCRLQTDTTSRSTNSGAVSRSPRRRARARSPSGPSSPSEVARTLASTTITIGSQRRHRCFQGDRPARAASRPVEDLVEGRFAGLLDEPGAQVFLQRLMCSGRALAQDRVSPLRHIFDLYTRHGAIMAPEAPKYNRAVIGWISRVGACVGGPGTRTSVSATGRWRLSRRLKCRAGLARSWLAAWRPRPRLVPWLRSGRCWRSQWPIAACSTTWRR